MEATLVRAFKSDKVTMGMLKIHGIDHMPIFTLENPLRDTSVDSCIPEGLYECVPYSSARFPNVYEIKDVPGRSHILFHAGNNEADTSGCILLGLSAGVMKEAPSVLESRRAIDLLRFIIGVSNFTLTIR